jgi:hypothetical protein
MNRRALLAVALAAAGVDALRAATARAQHAAVRVRREEPVVVREEFNPRQPPPDMPPLTPPEAGVCKTTFSLDASIGFSAEELSRTTVRIHVDELEIVTRARFDVFTALNSPAKLRAHEEGHRAIGEHYYEGAAGIAEEIGRGLIGKTYDGAGVDAEAARRDAFAKVVGELERDYMARVRTPSAAANERFDEITRHGLAAIEEAEAIALAIAGGPSP